MTAPQHPAIDDGADGRASTRRVRSGQSLTVLLYILVAGVFSVAGQIVMKRGLVGIGPIGLEASALPQALLSLALNPLIVLGLLVTVMGTFFWLITLSRVDLSFAYPFASLNYGLVLAAAWFLLDERVSPTRLLGVLTICAGVALVMRTPPQSARPSHAVRAAEVPVSWRHPA